jgi:hypothetical protein
MTQHFGYAVDRRYLPLLLPFRFKRNVDGVTLGDDTFEATLGFFTVTTTRDNVTGAHHPRLPLVDGVRCPGLDGRPRAQLRDQLQRGRLHPLRREGPVAAEQERSFSAHRDRRRPRGTYPCPWRGPERSRLTGGPPALARRPASQKS